MEYIYLIKIIELEHFEYYKLNSTDDLKILEEINSKYPFKLEYHKIFSISFSKNIKSSKYLDFVKKNKETKEELFSIFQDKKINSDWFLLFDTDIESISSILSKKGYRDLLTTKEILNRKKFPKNINEPTGFLAYDKLKTLHKQLYNLLPNEFSTKNIPPISSSLRMTYHAAKVFVGRNVNILFKKVGFGIYEKINKDVIKKKFVKSNIMPLKNPTSFYDKLPEEFTRKKALKIGFEMGRSENTTTAFLKRNVGRLFERTEIGYYKKIKQP